jgi:hypothetical protein
MKPRMLANNGLNGQAGEAWLFGRKWLAGGCGVMRMAASGNASTPWAEWKMRRIQKKCQNV